LKASSRPRHRRCAQCRGPLGPISDDDSSEDESGVEESGDEESASGGEDESGENSTTKKIVLAIVPFRWVVPKVVGSNLPPKKAGQVYHNFSYLDDDDNTRKTVDVKFANYKEGDGNIGMVTNIGAKILKRPFLVMPRHMKNARNLDTLAKLGMESANYVSWSVFLLYLSIALV
jgi:hypothetical protein